MKKPYMYLLLLSLLAFVPTAWATEIRMAGTHVQISATVEKQFANNEMVINFRMESEGMDADALRRTVDAMSHAVDQRLKGIKGIHNRQTTNRQLQIRWRYDKKTRERGHNGWLLRQHETITCALDVGPNIVMHIEQAGAHVGGIRFQIDRATQQRYRQNLEKQAIKDFRQRAKDLARSFDAKSFQILDLQTENRNSIKPRNRMGRMMLKSAPMADAAPSMHSGEQRLQATIRGTIVFPEHIFLVTP